MSTIFPTTNLNSDKAAIRDLATTLAALIQATSPSSTALLATATAIAASYQASDVGNRPSQYNISPGR